MSQASFDVTLSGASSNHAQTLLQAAWGWLAAFRARQASARDGKMLAALSEAQLKDAGIDRAAIAANRPIIEVRAGLMASLMSMR